MQSFTPSKAGVDNKAGKTVRDVLCHASTAPKHFESHGDKTATLEDKKTLSLLLKQNEKLIQKQVPSLKTNKKPEIPACIEACDVGSLLDKFLEYELNQSASVTLVKESSVVLTPVSSPSHKNSCNLNEALNGNKKTCISSAVGLTPPVSPPSYHNIGSVKSSSKLHTTPVITLDKCQKALASPIKPKVNSRKLFQNTVNASPGEKNSTSTSSMKSVIHKASSNMSMNNRTNKSKIHHTHINIQQNVSNETPNKRKMDCAKISNGKNGDVQEQKRKNITDLYKSEDSRISSLQSLQDRKTKFLKSTSRTAGDDGDVYHNWKRRCSSDDDDDDDKDCDYKRKKYVHGTKDECYWSTSEDESKEDRKPYCSRRRKEKYHGRRDRSSSTSNDSDDDDNDCSFYRSKGGSHTYNYQQNSKDVERETEKCNQKSPVYDIENERKKNFKLDRSFRETSTEKRKIVYIGNIDNSMTKGDVWRKFREYGPIEKVTVHYRTDGDNYSFVTFVDSSSALEAIEKGIHDPELKHLDICFGGRRKFCGGSYVDFDSNTSYLEENQNQMEGEAHLHQSNEEMDFDTLLKMCQKKSRLSS